MSVFESLPDDILEMIYSKIIYKENSVLLEEIIKYGLIRSWLYYLHYCNIEELNKIIIDLAVISLLLDEKIEPISVNPEQLSTYSRDILNQIYIEIEELNLYIDINDNDDYDKVKIHRLINIIKYYMMKIDIYYIEKIVEPIVLSIIDYELVHNNGKVTYKGLFYNELT
mgnify:CR=1 FL=1|tara:strand:- start:5725 stop:6231 length:507 start_codon:yes stop_codon:yes gene_type:complete